MEQLTYRDLGVTLCLLVSAMCCALLSCMPVCTAAQAGAHQKMLDAACQGLGRRAEALAHLHFWRRRGWRLAQKAFRAWNAHAEARRRLCRWECAALGTFHSS